MENREYHALLNMLLQVQSEDELIALVQQHPELLSEAFLTYVQQQLNRMNPLAAMELLQRLMMLAAIVQASTQIAAPAPQPADKLDIPDHIPPSTAPRAAWAKPLREFIARGFGDPAPLQEALRRAQRAGERELVALLSLLAQRQLNDAAEQVARLFPLLQQQGRLEEAYSLQLLPIAIEASRVELFRQFPLEQQMAVLQAGLTACEVGYRLSRALSDEACQAMFLVVKGRGLCESRQLEAAVEAYEEALAIYRQLAQQQPQVYEPYLATTLNNLGNALSDLRRLEAAVEAYQQALAIRRRLAQQQPQVYEPYLATTLNNLGNALRGLRRLEAAVEAYQQALAIRRRLAQQQPQVYEPDVATTLNNLGTALWGLRRLEAAVEAYQQALAIRRRLAQQQPQVYEPDVATTLNNLGTALRGLRRLEAAVEAYQQALAIRRRLAQQQPQVYEPYLATTLNNLGNALSDLRRLEAAVEAYQQALAIYRQLAQQQPQVYEPDVAMTLHNLGDALRGWRRYEAAVEVYQQALAIYNRHDIPDWKAITLGNLGRLYLSERRYEDALPYLREAADLVERLRAEGLRPERRRQIMDEYLPLYEDLLICLMRLELYDEALAVAERGKSRLLLDLLTAQELRPKNAPEPLQRRYEQLLFQARAIADELERPDPPDLPPDARETRRAQLRQEHQQVSRELDAVLREIRQADPAFLPATQPLTREEIVQLAQEAQTTLLSLRVTEEGRLRLSGLPRRQPRGGSSSPTSPWSGSGSWRWRAGRRTTTPTASGCRRSRSRKYGMGSGISRWRDGWAHSIRSCCRPFTSGCGRNSARGCIRC
jgi:tetratricopeptide (TPR) repeat protein